jgi:hypothetical protein
MAHNTSGGGWLMGEVWIPEAEDLNPSGSSGTMSGQGGPRCTLHCTVSNPGSFNAMHDVLTDKQAEPHLLYDYKTDRLGQYFPLNKSARALMSGSHSVSHNKMGSVNIQVEVCAQPVDWTADDDWHPGPNFRAMMRAIRSWGIADEFVYRPAKSSSDNVRRSWDTFDSSDTGGKLWWGHCHIPSPESHWDPGPLNVAAWFAAAHEEETNVDMTQENATDLFTGYAIMKDPEDPNRRVAPSYVIEYSAKAAAAAQEAAETARSVANDALLSVDRVELLAQQIRELLRHRHDDDDRADRPDWPGHE